MVTKRINKLRIAFELELAENIYSRFIKKGKNVKEKTSNATKARSSWSVPQG